MHLGFYVLPNVIQKEQIYSWRQNEKNNLVFLDGNLEVIKERLTMPLFFVIFFVMSSITASKYSFRGEMFVIPLVSQDGKTVDILNMKGELVSLPKESFDKLFSPATENELKTAEFLYKKMNELEALSKMSEEEKIHYRKEKDLEEIFKENEAFFDLVANGFIPEEIFFERIRDFGKEAGLIGPDMEFYIQKSKEKIEELRYR